MMMMMICCDVFKVTVLITLLKFDCFTQSINYLSLITIMRNLMGISSKPMLFYNQAGGFDRI